MGYVKISDPNIIDIAAWHQVINVVNQHSDSIDAITNNFGGTASGISDWSADTFAHVWDPGSQALVYGRTLMTTSTASNNSGSGATKVYYGTIQYSDTTISSTFQFSAAPIVTATLHSGDGTSITTANDTAVITIYNITSSQFQWRITSSDQKTALSGQIYIMWSAMGPR